MKKEKKSQIAKKLDLASSPISDAHKSMSFEELIENSLEGSDNYRRLFNSSLDGILVADIETRSVLHVNPAMCQLLEYTAEELETKKIEDIHPKEALPQIIDKYNAKPSSITDNAVSSVHLRDKRILVAEDNDINQLIAQKILAKMGFHTDIVGDGRQAIDALEKTHYDLVFMDLQMPIMDGFEATDLIRDGSTKAPDRNIPIIAMTASALKGDREECLNAGMNDYITKPVSIEAITKVLVRWLNVKLEV